MASLPRMRDCDRQLTTLPKRPTHRDRSAAPEPEKSPERRAQMAATALPCGAMLAQSRALEEMGTRFQAGGYTVSWFHILLLAVTAIAIVSVAALIAKRISIRDGEGFRSSKKLFRDLCRAHDLNWPTRRLLRQLAAVHDLSQPAELFVHPSCFQSELVDQLPQPVREQVSELRRRLFESTGTSAPDETTAATAN